MADQPAIVDGDNLVVANTNNQAPLNTQNVDVTSPDSDDEDSDREILSVAMDVWRTNITQYMSKLEVEIISAHNIPKRPRAAL